MGSNYLRQNGEYEEDDSVDDISNDSVSETLPSTEDSCSSELNSNTQDSESLRNQELWKLLISPNENEREDPTLENSNSATGNNIISVAGGSKNISNSVVLENKCRENSNVIDDKYCIFCKRNYAFRSNYISHRDFHCPFQRKYQIVCKLCDRKYTTRGSLIRHLKIVHNIKYESNNRATLEAVVPISDQTSVISRKRFRCQDCDGLYIDGVKSRESHSKKCLKIKVYTENCESKSECEFSLKKENGRLRCSNCGKRKSGEKSLRKHERRCTKKKNRTSRNINKKRDVFTNAENSEITVQKPTANKTSHKRRSECNICNIAFRSESKLKRHLGKRTCQKTFQDDNLFKTQCCRFCNLQCQTVDDLEKHELSCESRNVVYRCSNCQSCFNHCKDLLCHKTKCNIDSSIIVSDNNTSNIEQDENPKIVLHFSKKKKNHYFQFYKCGICYTNYFKNLKLFQKHLRTHESIAIKCTDCETSFNKFRIFRKHLKKIKSKIYICKSKVSDGEIENNESCNESELPADNNTFLCNVCKKQFPDISVLIEHIKKHLLIEGEVE